MGGIGDTMASGPVISLAHMRCGDCPIRHRAVCSTCDPQELAELDRIKTYRTYAAGEVLAWAGDRLTTLGSIVRGAATLSRTLPDGRRTAEVGLYPRPAHHGQGWRRGLPDGYEQALEILLASLDQPSSRTVASGMGAFVFLPHVFFVAEYGLDHFEASMRAQYLLTTRTHYPGLHRD